MSFKLGSFYIFSYAQNPFALQLIGSAGLTSAGKTLDITGIPAKNVVLVMITSNGKAGADKLKLRINGDAAGHYDLRYSQNGAADTTAVNQTEILLEDSATNLGGCWMLDIQNILALDYKRITGSGTYGEAAGVADNRISIASKWQSATALNQLTLFTTAQDMTAGATIYVFGST